jgi:hypothetical protein
VTEFGLPVCADDWPWGLRCATCERELRDGDHYSERLIELIPQPCEGDSCGAWPVVELVCLGCVF